MGISPVTTYRTAGSSLPFEDPVTAGFDLDRLRRIDSVIGRRIDSGELPGMISVIARGGTLVRFEAQGYDDTEARDPLRADGIMAIASLTKPIAATALLMVYEETGVMLDDPISRYIPEFQRMQVHGRSPSGDETLTPANREITFRDCLTHTAGFARTPVPTVPTAGNLIQAQEPMEQAVLRLAEEPLNAQPGTHWEYGPGIGVAGRLVEVITGRSLEDFCRQRIFEPLGMVDTSFILAPEKAHRLVNLYNRVEKDGHLRLVRGASKDVRAEAAARRVRFDGSGGLFSTAADYLRFAQMLLSGGTLDGVRILSRKTVELMTTNHVGDLPVYVYGPGYGYGLGVFVRRDLTGTPLIGSIGAYGWGGATGCSYVADPKEELLLLSFSNTNGYWQNRHRGWNWLHQFEKLAYQALID
jgi:CubicO group peptidase (beta-lactamase class C family)